MRPPAGAAASTANRHSCTVPLTHNVQVTIYTLTWGGSQMRCVRYLGNTTEEGGDGGVRPLPGNVRRVLTSCRDHLQSFELAAQALRCIATAAVTCRCLRR